MNRRILWQEVESTEAALDRLVYRVDGLTEEEIGIVEKNG
jgi:hypothetical protein